MLEDAIRFLSDATLPVIAILLFGLFITFLENIFPPAPCDSIVVFIGALIGFGKVDLISTLIFTTIGSSIGFTLMYWMGWQFGTKIIESNRFSFISNEALEKPRKWFLKYGYIVIFINRFLSGTRAVISFFAGISKLNISKTIILATLSSLIWNFLLLYLGMKFGKHWEVVVEYMDEFGNYTIIVVVLIIIAILIKWLISRYKSKK